MKSIAADGGPLVALPLECAAEWLGTEAPRGASVPPGWQWTGDDDDPVRTDYDRACGPLASSYESGYGGVGVIEVAGVNGLVFRRSLETTFVPLEDGGVFVRNVVFASAKEARKVVDVAGTWEDTRIRLALTDGRLVLFDATYPYRATRRRRPAPAPSLVASLGAGEHRVLACESFAVDRKVYAYRLVRADR